jgi:hypothetical protein
VSDFARKGVIDRLWLPKLASWLVRRRLRTPCGGEARISKDQSAILTGGFGIPCLHDHVDGVYTQRIYFWDESREDAGCAEFAHDQVLHVAKIKQRIRKIVTDAAYRERHRRELEFPVERHYS